MRQAFEAENWKLYGEGFTLRNSPGTGESAKLLGRFQRAPSERVTSYPDSTSRIETSTIPCRSTV